MKLKANDIDKNFSKASKIEYSKSDMKVIKQ